MCKFKTRVCIKFIEKNFRNIHNVVQSKLDFLILEFQNFLLEIIN